jgi:K+-transporting ATPase ATPase B chain
VEHFLMLQGKLANRHLNRKFYDSQSSFSVRLENRRPGGGRRFQKARPPPDGQEPRHVRDDGGRALTTAGIFTATADRGFIAQLALWLWFTVLFANFAEAVAEGRGKAQAQALRGTRANTVAAARQDGQVEAVSADGLRKGDVVLVHAAK